MDGLVSIFLFAVGCNFHLQFMQHTQIVGVGGFDLGSSGCEICQHNPLISKNIHLKRRSVQDHLCVWILH